MNRQTHQQGTLLALTAFVTWGFMPVYFKQIGQIPILELMAHRAIWSAVFLIPVVIIAGQWAAFVAICKSPRQLLILLGTSSLIAFSWYLYIYAINHNQILDTSLAYYLNPLLNIALGFILLKEPLNSWRGSALLLAGIGVASEVILLSSLPWISIGLAVQFSIYGLVRRKIGLGSLPAGLAESLLLVLPALIYLLSFRPTGDFFPYDWQTNSLLLLAGPLQTIPIVLYTAAALRLPFINLSFMQFLAPSLAFLLAVSLYGETFTQQKAITFGFIGAALTLFLFDLYRTNRKQHYSGEQDQL